MEAYDPVHKELTYFHPGFHGTSVLMGFAELGPILFPAYHFFFCVSFLRDLLVTD